MDIRQVFDFNKIQPLMDSFCQSVGIASAIIDLEGTAFLSSNWQKLCTDFHRQNPGTCKRCIENDTFLAGKLLSGEKYAIYTCRNGLTNAASPIVVHENHIGNLFVGQFLLNPPDMDHFREQSLRYGFNEAAYMEALSHAPIIHEVKVQWILKYLVSFAELLGDMGLNAIRQMETHKQLQKSEEKYRGIFDESVTAIYVFDANKNFIDTNQAGLDLLDYSREELLSMCIPDVDADPIVVQPAHKQLLSGERIINYEHKLRRKDGEIIIVLNNSRPLFDTHGNVIGMQSTLIDITDSKQAEELLKHREKELENRTKNLEEVNIALKVLLKQRDEDKAELEEKVLSNMKKLVDPYLEKLKKGCYDSKLKTYIEIIESNLKEIISPFSRNLSSIKFNLTPVEIQVSDLIKQGRSTKEISELLNISTETVGFHRKNIRKKFALKNTKTNLKTYLASLN